DAARLCAAKKGGTLVVRTACKKGETTADVGTLLPKGAPGSPGDAGAPGPARGWVHVDDSAQIVAGSHFTGVQNVATGVYCLTPDDTIDAASSLGLVTVEYGYSSGSDLVAYVHFPASACPSGTFQVDTVTRQGNPSDSVAFVFLVI